MKKYKLQNRSNKIAHACVPLLNLQPNLLNREEKDEERFMEGVGLFQFFPSKGQKATCPF
jgi:hypothetical protein